jgi:rare lipoprotein A
MASWYGEPFHGRRTASGEVYDMEAMTCAHRTLPFGARIRVENLDNGRSTTLTVNDRGPFVEGRIVDVSRRGARELGMLGPGTARVRITVVG